MNRFLFAPVVLGLALLVACSSNEGGPALDDVAGARKIADEVRPAVDQVVQANNQFACDLYRRLGASESGNLFFSPFSISTALSMTWAGARGATAADMARVLHFTGPPDDIHDGFQALLGSLNTGAGLGGYELTTANRLWGQAGFDFLPPYRTLTREKYGAGLEEMDFRADPEDSRQTINRWVEQETRDRIQDLLPGGSITPDTRLVLTNAIYYKGKWQNMFDPDETRDAVFHLDADRQVQVPMMQQGGPWKVGGDGKARMLRLPYSGRDLDMLVLLPGPEEGLGGLEARLTPELVKEWIDGLGEEEIDVYLPRFTVTSQFSLRLTLSDMGMGIAFQDRADLTGMRAAGNLFIQDAIHKAFVKVNEEGTEAAAATGVIVGVTSVGPLDFRADRPFLFIIRDDVTGSFLFIGRVVDPTA